MLKSTEKDYYPLVLSLNAMTLLGAGFRAFIKLMYIMVSFAIKTKSMLKGKLFSNVSYLISANLVSQILNIGTLAAIAKQYSAYSFGILTMFMVIPSILLSFSTGRYEQSIQLARSDREAMSVLFVSLTLVLIVSFLTLGSTLVFGSQLSELVGSGEIQTYLPFTALFVFFAGLFQIIRVWSLRKNRFRSISRAVMAQTIIGNLLIIFGSFTSHQILALVSGTFVKQYFASFPLLLHLKKNDIHLLWEVAFKDVWDSARKYFHLSRSLMIGYSLASLNFQIIVMTIGRLWGVEVLGQFQLAYRIALLPCTIIADAVSEIFKQQAIQLFHEKGHFEDFIKQTLKVLMAAAFLPYLIGVFITPRVLSHFLEDKWGAAIILVQILLVESYFTLTISPIDKWASIIQDRRYIYKWQIGKTLSIVIVSILTSFFNIGLYFYLSGTSCVVVCFYVIDILNGVRRCGPSRGKELRLSQQMQMKEVK